MPVFSGDFGKFMPNSISSGRSIRGFAGFFAGLGGGFEVVGDRVPDADAAIAHGDELRVADCAALVDLAACDAAVGVDFVVRPHRGCGEKHHMQALVAVDGGAGFAQHECVAEQEGADRFAGAAVAHLGVELGLGITAEVENAKLAGLAGSSGDADFLSPVRASWRLAEEYAVGRSAFSGAAGRVDHGDGGKVSWFGELEMLREVDLAGERLAGANFHRAKNFATSWVHGGAIAVFDREVEPLEASIALEDQLASGVVGDGDHGQDRLAGEVLFFGDFQ